MQAKRIHKKGAEALLKRTPQRLAILEYLDGNTSHPSAEDIFRTVSKKFHSMSFATVYNTLNALVRAGLVRELTLDPERKRYDPDTGRHNHLICILCGRIVDVPEQIAVDPPRDAARDFTILGSHIEFYGQCTACKKNEEGFINRLPRTAGGSRKPARGGSRGSKRDQARHLLGRGD